MTGLMFIVVLIVCFHGFEILEKRRYKRRNQVRNQVSEKLREEQQKSVDALNQQFLAYNEDCAARNAIYSTLSCSHNRYRHRRFVR